MSKKIKPPALKTRQKIRGPSLSVQTTSSSNDTHPAFCLRYIQSDYSVDRYSKEIKANFAERLQQLGQIPWKEIQKSPRHGMGHEKISRNSIQQPLPLNTPYDREFLAFRLGGSGKQATMVGYRKEKVFYIIWIDPNGEVYEHG